MLCSSPVLKLPDFTKPFFVEPDASNMALGAILLQWYNNRLHPVVFFSKKYVPAERNYAPHNKELLEIFKACQKWRCYSDRHQTTVFTDYKPLFILQP